MAPHAAQTRVDVLQLCELHLQAPFARRGVAAEDVEDKSRTVDDLHVMAHRALEVGLLRGAKLVVKDHDVGFERLDGAYELFYLA